jgi:hypothetical protein
MLITREPSLLVDKNEQVPNGILSLLIATGSQATGHVESALSVSRLLLERESSVNNQNLMGRSTRAEPCVLLLTSTRLVDRNSHLDG